LALMCADVVVWEGERWPQFHLHTDQPGQVVEQIYATGMPFDLAITSLSGAERRG
jgi:dihydroxyacetone kinase-like predicted kinase